jgi:hypothetical protein
MNGNGNAKRKAKAEEELREAGRDDSKVRRSKIKRPPKDAVGKVAWASDVAAKCLYEVMAHPTLKLETRWRYASDLIAKIGLTHSKALTEEKILKLERKLGLDKGARDEDGLEPDPEA